MLLLPPPLLLLLAAVSTSVVASSGPPQPQRQDAFYDCQLRELARDYTSQVILNGWSAERRASALRLVSAGLRLSQCNISAALAAVAPPAPAASLSPAPAVVYYVATAGSDSAAGTKATPLATIAGAQAKIRAAHPAVSGRPPITVYIGAGDYFYGAAGADHLQTTTRYSSTASKYAMARFSAADSGASVAAPITYTAAPDAATAPRFLGGVALKGLRFAAAGAGLPVGVLKASVPGNVSVDVQDQLFLLPPGPGGGDMVPLVRGRTPNGRPWIPLDGFNLTVHSHFGALAGPDVHASCASKPNPGPKPPKSKPDRPKVPRGGCLSAPNTTLLNGITLPTPVITPTAAACATLCHANACCSGYTWHDKSTGTYFKDCYLIRSEDDAWVSSGPYIGHQSGLCDHSDITPKPQCPADTYMGICKQSTVICAATNLTQVIGSIGTVSTSGRALAGSSGLVKIDHCLEHLLDLANDWPSWVSKS
jgi:hypothetical protein